MAVLSAVFKGVDNISSVFDRMANSGARVIGQWDKASGSVSNAFERSSASAESAAKTIEAATSSTHSATEALDNFERVTIT